MTIASKVNYVRRQGQTRDHECHWPGCNTQVRPAFWGCQRHWYTLPQHLRNKVWATYRPGQEITLTPSAEYLAVAQEIQEWIRARESNGAPSTPPIPDKE